MLGGLFDPIEHGFILFGLKTSGGLNPSFPQWENQNAIVPKNFYPYSARCIKMT